MKSIEGIRLKKGKEAIFLNRHLWIFSGAIESFPTSFENGSIQPIYTHEGVLLGHGYFHQGMSLAGRVVSRGSVDPMDAIYSHLDRAIGLRKELFSGQKTTGFRLVNGEGDFLPGLIIDQYGDHLVLQSNTLGIDSLKPKIVDYLVSKGFKTIHEKSIGPSRKEEKLPDQVTTLCGEATEELEMQENGFTFYLNWKFGQKTGFFLDQREMRKKVGELSLHKRVFNCFCYTGGFSVYSLANQANSVDSLDVSKAALLLAQKNMGVNGFSNGHLIEEDAFKFLETNRLEYDLIVLDPPAFAKKRGDIKAASNGYRHLNKEVLSKMPSGALLLTASCSYYIDEPLFQTILFQAAILAKREVQIISKHIQAADHPVSLFHPESNYLKSFLLRVL